MRTLYCYTRVADKRQRNLGFTLIELLIVIAILGVLSTLIVFQFRGAQAAARDSRRQSDVKQYQTALEVYANANAGVYPIRTTTVNAISLCGSTNPLGNIPCADDTTVANHYLYNSNASGTQYIVWATLEKPNPAQVFYVCSSGKAATVVATGFNPTSGACP